MNAAPNLRNMGHSQGRRALGHRGNFPLSGGWPRLQMLPAMVHEQGTSHRCAPQTSSFANRQLSRNTGSAVWVAAEDLADGACRSGGLFLAWLENRAWLDWAIVIHPVQQA